MHGVRVWCGARVYDIGVFYTLYLKKLNQEPSHVFVWLACYSLASFSAEPYAGYPTRELNVVTDTGEPELTR